MKKLIIFFVIILVLVFPTHALTMHVSGNCVNNHVEVKLDKSAFVIFRMNNGTPIYAFGSKTSFVPHVTGDLQVEAILGSEKVSKTIPIIEGLRIKENALPSGTFTKTVDGKKYEIKWRTALGALEKASKIRGFDYVLEKKPWGFYVKCIRGKCEKSDGATSGWMYWVNYPKDPLPGVSADQYEVKGGDKIVWYFSRSMDETPDTSPYKIEISLSQDYDVGVIISWNENIPIVKTQKKIETRNETKNQEFSKVVRLKPGVTKVEIPSDITEILDLVSLELKAEKNEDVFINISKSKLLSPVIARSVYKTFELKANKTIYGCVEFRLPKQWLDTGNATDVVLMEDNNDLKTKLVGEDSRYFYYKSNFSTSGIFAIAVKWKDFPLNVSDEPIIKALRWLKLIQKKDGGFANPGEESDVSKTSWAIMALVAANQDPHSWKKNGKSPIDYLKEHLNESIGKMGTADYARTILALKAANENPRNFSNINFVAKLKGKLKSNGQIGDFIYTTIWGILALNACGENVTKSVEWLINQQNDDGGFAWAVGEKSDYDDTAAAIQALIASGIEQNSNVVKKALEYLKTGQNDDGGFKYFGNSASNAASDSWIMQALVAAGENPTKWKKDNTSVVDHLLSLQTEEGYFKYTNFQTSNPGYMTVCAIMALLGKPHPIKAENYTNVTKIIEKIEKKEAIIKEIKNEEIKNKTKYEKPKPTEKQIPETPGFGVILAILAIAIVILRRV